MNYYERHLGDYAKDTAHLTMLEHGAYTLLLDRYYSTEEGIPADQAHRVARARTKEERAAVDTVLSEFFIQEQGVWINRRAAEEIDKAHKRISASKINGRKGGRPRKEPDPPTGITHEKPGRFSPGSNEQTRQKAYQTPETIYQTDESSLIAPSRQEKTQVQQRCLQIAMLLRESGIRPITNRHAQTLQWACDPAVTDEILLAAVETARQYKPDTPISPAYLMPIIRQLTTPVREKKESDSWWLSHEGIDRKGRELGIVARPLESYADYKSRLFNAIRETQEKRHQHE